MHLLEFFLLADLFRIESGDAAFLFQREAFARCVALAIDLWRICRDLERAIGSDWTEHEYEYEYIVKSLGQVREGMGGIAHEVDSASEACVLHTG
jgi:hypothetical protein